MLLGNFEREVEVVEVIALATKGDTNNEASSKSRECSLEGVFPQQLVVARFLAPTGRRLRFIPQARTREGYGRLHCLGVD